MGGVIYIGDRQAGKTHLAVELANDKTHQWVKVIKPTYANLLNKHIDKFGVINRTEEITSVYEENLEVQVKIQGTELKIVSSWLDTPGEIWRESWQKKLPSEWNKFIKSIRNTEGILLILPPYREIIKKSQYNPDDFITRQQWINRFQKWIDFFHQDCGKIRHLCICLNKADLFFQNPKDLELEASELAYDPYTQTKNWQEKHEYVYLRYFAPLHSHLRELNRNLRGLTVRCFITSIHHRVLLELPWIYLGSYLGKD